MHIYIYTHKYLELLVNVIYDEQYIYDINEKILNY